MDAMIEMKKRNIHSSESSREKKDRKSNKSKNEFYDLNTNNK